MNELRDAVRFHAEAHAGVDGVSPTPIPGLTTVRATAPSGLVHAIPRPLACLVVQGAKRVTMGDRDFDFSAGDTLLITADVPTVSQITRASRAAPYYSLVVELDAALIADLVTQMGGGKPDAAAPLRVDSSDRETADAALRLLRLLDRPQAVPMLHGALLREFHYWLLAGKLGPAIRRLGWPDGQAARVARAVALLRRDFAKPLRVDDLADVAGMSASSFHQHFRAVTSLSPLQFQKRLRLIEARRLMQAEGASAGNAAFAVGYESVHQFTREYGRMFGLPPVRDAKAARGKIRVAA
ncbi:MAG: AraC family transcriptional regulator [Alphaproteobacteria bacterium]|nr:AraC family transcriptional regulator [Alphaproteobacteria bacterium]